MVLVLTMMIGLAVGFVSGILGIDFFKAEKRTPAVTIKAIIALAMIICGCVVTLMKNWSYTLSFVLGAAVGLAPYFSSHEKESETDTDENA